jgi:hypothetical protein
MVIRRDWNTKYERNKRNWEPFKGFTTVVLTITGILFCVGIVVLAFGFAKTLGIL